jgi:surface antigen
MELFMLLNRRNFLLLIWCCLSGCSTVTNEKPGHIPSGPSSIEKTKIVEENFIGEKVEIGLSKLISSPKMKLGQNLEPADQQIISSLTIDTLNNSVDNNAVTWNNPVTGRSGILQILSTEGSPTEQLVCRQFSHTLIVNNEKEIINGKACRGMWDPKQPWILHG